MKSPCALACTIMIAGCASNPGIVPAGGDMYRLARSAYGLGASQSDVMSSIMKEASDYCTASSKRFDVVSSDSKPGWPGHFPEAELIFKCAAK